MLDEKNLLALMKAVAKADASKPTAYSFNGESFTYEALNETLRNELNELVGTNALYRENKNKLFSLIEQTIDEVLPAKVSAAYDQFAETRQFAQGDKPIFRRKMSSRTRAKQFVTRVGLAGRYEVFKLAKFEESFEVPTSAIGAAGQIGFEEFLDGRVDFSEIIDIIMEGMDELIYHEIGEALKASINQLPAANRVVSNGFDEAEMDRLLTVASAYGTPTIYCTYEFAVRMIPQEAWRYTEAMKDELYRTGKLAGYKGHNVVILPQGFEDGTNEVKVIDPGYAFIIPSGADNKPVKVAFEGGLQTREVEGEDWSRTIQCYQKVGVSCMLANNICIFVDSSLLGKMTDWYLEDTVENVVVNKA